MEKIYDKPFKSYEEQLNKLKMDYKLKIEDEKYALKMLRTISYYNIVNGYKECFMENGIFKEEVTFNNIIVMIMFEKFLVTVLFKYSTYVEDIFKTRLAYTIAKNISVDENEYLKSKYYNQNKTKKNRSKKFYQTIADIKGIIISPDYPTKHYKNKHNHIPPWILFKNVYFNNVIDLFSFLKLDMQKEIIKEYSELYLLNLDDNIKVKNIKKMLTIVRKFRNKIAHNAKVFNYQVPKKQEIIFKEVSKLFPSFLWNIKDFKKSRGIGDLYSAILCIYFLLEEKTLRKMFITELNSVFYNFESIGDLKLVYLKSSNLPENIKNRLEFLLKNLE